MKQLTITWVKNDDEDFVRIEEIADGFNKFEIVGLLEDMKAKVVFNKLQKEVQNAEDKG